MTIADQLASQSTLITLKCGPETGWIATQAVARIRSLEESLLLIRDSTFKSAVVLRGIADRVLGDSNGH